MVGVIVVDGLFNWYDVVFVVVEKICSCYYLFFVLFVVDNVEDMRQWCQYWFYGVVVDLVVQVDVMFIGVGMIGLGCVLQVDGFISVKDVDDLLVYGVVGELIGWLIDVQGCLLDVLLQICIISLLFKLMLLCFVIVIVGGVVKVGVIGVVL